MFPLLLPILSACIGWLFAEIMTRFLFAPVLPGKFFGVTLQGVFPRYRHVILSSGAEYIAGQLFSFGDLREKISDPDNLQRIMPEMEKHIDHFLRVKLKVSMPMIGMLVGERTILQMKEIFLKELEELFPIIMASYIGTMKEDFDPATMIRQKLATIPAGTLEPVLLNAIAPFIKYVKTTGALLGLVIGTINVLLFYFYR